jgi:N4-gp56 family major capsid protein
MLDRAVPEMCMAPFGQQQPIPRNRTNVVRFRRYNGFVANTTPLQEGVTPVADTIVHTDVEAVLRQYGRRTQVTDVIQDTHEDPVLNEYAEVMGEVAGQTLELVIYGRLLAGTNVLFAGGTTRATVNSAITKVALDRAIRQLKRNNAKPITKMLSASDKVGTRSVRKSFIAFVHPDMETDLESIAGYLPVNDYGTQQPLHDAELGSYRNIRFMASTLYAPFLAAGASGSTLLTNGGPGTGNADVYPIVIVGKDAFATVSLAGASAVTPIVLTPKPAPGDELGQRGSVGFKMYGTACILNDAWMVRIEAGVNQ